MKRFVSWACSLVLAISFSFLPSAGYAAFDPESRIDIYQFWGQFMCQSTWHYGEYVIDWRTFSYEDGKYSLQCPDGTIITAVCIDGDDTLHCVSISADHINDENCSIMFSQLSRV